MEDVVVFAALGWEARAALDALQGVEVVGLRTWRGYLGDGGSVRVRQTGVGLARATQAAAEAVGARLYLSCGCAGAVVPGLVAGDLVIGDRVIGLDRGGRSVGDVRVDPVALAVWSGARSIAIRIGAVASSPVVLSCGAAKAAVARHGALVVEMESVAIAGAARDHGVACAVVKVVLDEAGDAVGLPGDVVDEETGEIDMARVLLTLAVHPHVWRRALRLARQKRTAERRLRDYLAVVFSAGLDALGLGPRTDADGASASVG